MVDVGNLTHNLQALALGLGLVLVSVTIQGFGMAGIARLVGRAKGGRSFLYMPLTVAALVALHLAVVCVYAAVYALAVGVMDLGAFENADAVTLMDLFYFSLITYSTLGLGDLLPQGAMRLIVGVQVLNGFLLLTSSATFLFYSMGLLRPQPPSADEIQKAAEEAAEDAAEEATEQTEKTPENG